MSSRDPEKEYCPITGRDPSRQALEIARLGTRTLAGTDWPVYDALVRDQRRGQKPTWEVIRGLCNGICSRITEFGTEREAREAWASRWEATPREARQRKPIALTISDETRAKLDRLAEEAGESRSAVVERLVLDHVT